VEIAYASVLSIEEGYGNGGVHVFFDVATLEIRHEGERHSDEFNPLNRGGASVSHGDFAGRFGIEYDRMMKVPKAIVANKRNRTDEGDLCCDHGRDDRESLF
jgi:hypothetical protein